MSAGGGWLVRLNRDAESAESRLSLPKGAYAHLRIWSAEPSFETRSPTAFPWLADRAEGLSDWKQTSLLSIEVNRLQRWYGPGLLLIGDAAHTMSPVAGVGITAGHAGRGRRCQHAGTAPGPPPPILLADLRRISSASASGPCASCRPTRASPTAG